MHANYVVIQLVTYTHWSLGSCGTYGQLYQIVIEDRVARFTHTSANIQDTIWRTCINMQIIS